MKIKLIIIDLLEVFHVIINTMWKVKDNNDRRMDKEIKIDNLFEVIRVKNLNIDIYMGYLVVVNKDKSSI